MWQSVIFESIPAKEHLGQFGVYSAGTNRIIGNNNRYCGVGQD